MAHRPGTWGKTHVHNYYKKITKYYKEFSFIGKKYYIFVDCIHVRVHSCLGNLNIH